MKFQVVQELIAVFKWQVRGVLNRIFETGRFVS
ncbi:hypothetical protein WG8_4133 [Paenibacillus sp. Aloe-11]|nr:hypothetical protein WG8_4133 [Paenibacillus sp. Aloe-11]